MYNHSLVVFSFRYSAGGSQISHPLDLCQARHSVCIVKPNTTKNVLKNLYGEAKEWLTPSSPFPQAYIPPSTIKTQQCISHCGQRNYALSHFRNCFYFKTVKSSSIYTKSCMYSDKSFNKYCTITVTKMLWYHPHAMDDKQKQDTRCTECLTCIPRVLKGAHLPVPQHC